MVGSPSFKGIVVNVKEVLVRGALMVKESVNIRIKFTEISNYLFYLYLQLYFSNLSFREEIPNSVKDNISLLYLSINRSFFAKS